MGKKRGGPPPPGSPKVFLSFKPWTPRRIGARGSSIIGTSNRFFDHRFGGSLERFTRSRLASPPTPADHLLTEHSRMGGRSPSPLCMSRSDREPQPRPVGSFLGPPFSP